MRINTDKIIVAGDMSLATITSTVMNLEHMLGFAVQAIWTGAGASGTIKLQASIDGITFSDIPNSAQTILGAGSFIWNMENGKFYKYFQVVYTKTGGSTGTLNVLSNVKGL